jgi:hypothetical protein
MTDLHVNPLWYLCGGGPFILAAIMFLIVTKLRRRDLPRPLSPANGIVSSSPSISTTSFTESAEAFQPEPRDTKIAPEISPRIMAAVPADPPQQFIFKNESYNLPSAGISSLLGSPPSHPTPASPVNIYPAASHL